MRIIRTILNNWSISLCETWHILCNDILLTKTEIQLQYMDTNTHTHMCEHNGTSGKQILISTHNRFGSGHQCHRQNSSEKLFLQRAIHNHLLMAFNYKLHSMAVDNRVMIQSIVTFAISKRCIPNGNRLNRIHILITREVTLFSRRKNGNGRNLINLKCGPALMQSNWHIVHRLLAFFEIWWCLVCFEYLSIVCWNVFSRGVLILRPIAS